MFTHRVITNYIDDTGVAIGGSNQYTGNVEKNYDNAAVPGPTTGLLVPITAAKANIQSMCFSASQPTTIKTNSDTTPSSTITLAAGQTIVWTFDSSAPNPIVADVTAIYIDVPGTNPSAVKIRMLLSQ